jgi:hypothetical protein
MGGFMLGRSMIYFAIVEETNHVKIGYTYNDRLLKKRLSYLQTGNPHSIKLFASFPVSQEIERWLHGRFREFRVLGEWFHFTEPIKSWIEKCNIICQETGVTGYHLEKKLREI